jgi:hypothetical protein
VLVGRGPQELAAEQPRVGQRRRHQRRLADPWLTLYEGHTAPPAGHRGERIAQLPDLGVAADDPALAGS